MSITSSFPSFSTGFEQLIAFQTGSVQALIESNKAFVAGLQEISKEFIAVTEETVEKAATAGSQMTQAKSLQQFISLQVAGAQSGYEALVSNTTKLSGLGMQVAKATMAPITARFTEVAGKVAPLAA